MILQPIVVEAIATEIARRWDAQEGLGRPSVYNIAREVLNDFFGAPEDTPKLAALLREPTVFDKLEDQ